jgi:hypothetical protein
MFFTFINFLFKKAYIYVQPNTDLGYKQQICKDTKKQIQKYILKKKNSLQKKNAHISKKNCIFAKR